MVPLKPYYNRVFFRIREGLNNPAGTLIGSAGLSITTNQS
jgi:adhesin HecA-like repeat protein